MLLCQLHAKVSSAHLDRFHSQGSVILRGLVNNCYASNALAAAAGIACRLLKSPGCRLIYNMNEISSQDVVEVCFAFHEQNFCVGNQAVYYLNAGDAWVHNTVICQPSLTKYSFQAATADSPGLTFLDPFYGSRGETPTTVVQWSKGTIF